MTPKDLPYRQTRTPDSYSQTVYMNASWELRGPGRPASRMAATWPPLVSRHTHDPTLSLLRTITIEGNYTGLPATSDDGTVIFVARR